MTNLKSKKHFIALAMLSVTAIIWGWGFVLNDQLLSQMPQTPTLLNAIRFSIAALFLTIIFAKKVKLNKQAIICSAIGGTFLFFAFWLQIIGLNYTTPAHSGFFTASYVVIVPLIVWITRKKRPTTSTIIGVLVAFAGLALLNIGTAEGAQNALIGDLLTLAGAVMFALQIVWSERVMSQNETDQYTFTTLQMTTTALLFVLATLIFESDKYCTLQIEFSYIWWRFAIVALFGTTFAYFAQTYAQIHIPSAETALVLGCESPIGAIISIALGLDAFGWNIVCGGILVILSVILVEVVPQIKAKRKNNDLPE